MKMDRRSFLKFGTIGIGAAGAAGLAVTLGGCNSEETKDSSQQRGGSYAAGSYKGVSRGKNGDIQVEVTFDKETISDVVILKHRETEPIAGNAIRYITQSIIDGQTLNVDAVSGATLTSHAIITAVGDCADQAGGSSKTLLSAEEAPSSSSLTPGLYTAASHGHHSDIEVEVVLGDSEIEKITVLSEGETFNLSDKAIEELPLLMVENQTTGVDVISGATYTSKALESAVELCIEKAGGFEAVRYFGKRVLSESWSQEERSLEYDVVVVGSGMAGIAAALSAQEQGSKVAIVEKLPYWGGVSQTCKGFFSFAYDETDAAVESYYDYGVHMHCGPMQGETVDENYPNKELMRTLANNSHLAGKWLEGMGAPLMWTPPLPLMNNPEYLTGYAQFVVDEGDEAPDLAGKAFKKLIDGFTEKGGDIYLEQPVKELMVDPDGAVSGIKTEGKDGKLTISAKSVVLCAGGFGNNEEMIKEYAPSYEGEYNVTLSGNTGDGIRMATSIGAEVYDQAVMMGQFGHSVVTDYDMVHPYEDNETPVSSIFVNPMGLRMNSENPAPYTGGSVYVNPDPEYRDYYWAVMNESVFEAAPEYKDIFNEQYESGNERFYMEETLADLAKAIRISPATLRYSINRYNRFCESGVDEDYLKHPDFLVSLIDEGPWRAVKCELVYFGTVGGLVIDVNGAVLDSNKRPIKGLYAAGENANGGLFNLSYVGARSMTVCLVMGKIAGASAATM